MIHRSERPRTSFKLSQDAIEAANKRGIEITNKWKRKRGFTRFFRQQNRSFAQQRFQVFMSGVDYAAKLAQIDHAKIAPILSRVFLSSAKRRIIKHEVKDLHKMEQEASDGSKALIKEISEAIGSEEKAHQFYEYFLHVLDESKVKRHDHWESLV